MQTFSLTDLARNGSAMKHAAARAPIALTERKKPRFVLMAVEDYERLTGAAGDPRRVFKVVETPEDVLEPLMAGLDRLIFELDLTAHEPA